MAGLSVLRMMDSLAPCLVLLLSIELTNAQFSVPVITNYTALDNRYLPESLPLGYDLGTISAYDPDGTAVTYSIRDSGGEYFFINPTTGQVTLKKLLDYETDIEIKMTIRVEDGNGQVTTRDAKVFVNDENDNAPVFTKTGLSNIIREDAAVGFVVAPITVTDRDTKNSIINVSCEGQTPLFQDACDTFRLNVTSRSNKNWIGNVILNKPLDYETRIAYNILLAARDGVHTVTSEVHVEVEDINDSPPRWILTGPKIINEEEPIGTSIQRVSAVDGDTTNPRSISYSLIGPNTDIFQINSTSGVISNAKRLDYDSGDHQKGVPYDVVIKASEVVDPVNGIVGNNNLTTATVSIKITVEDINDNAPTFSQKEYTAYVDENIVSGSNIPGLQMTITDIDSGTFNSFDLLTLNHTDVFGIIPSEDAASSSATIYVKDGQKIDYETGPRQYIIDVRAIENKVQTGIHTGSATVTIFVRDVNDMTPSFDSEVYVRNVSETASANTFIIDLNATDPEAGDFGTQGIRYKLYGNIPAHFQINEITGVVSVAPCDPPGRPGLTPCIDYERKQEYTLTVSATDNRGNGRTRSVQLIIGVIDENDNQPRIDATYTRYIYEEQTTTINPLRIEPIDPDTVGGPLTFSLRGDTSGLWQITPEVVNGRLVGNITARRPILYEDATDQSTGEFNFAVVVEDQKYSTTANVKIIVIDINNNAPVFSSPQYVEAIEETTLGEVFVTKVTASDADAPTTGNGVVDFYIERGALGKFMITNVTQVNNMWVADVYTTKDATFNYDVQNQYVMPLIVRDRGSPESKNGTALLTVNILDINNRDPRIRPSFQTINVRENEPIGTTVYQVTATDPDQQSRLEFYMNATNAIDGTLKDVDPNVVDFNNMFRIEKDTGNVVVNAHLDRDIVSRITNALTVYDTMANPRQTGEGTLLIRILEYNDQAPQFDLPLYEITIDEELNINSFVRNLNCQDEDDKIERYDLEQVVPRRPEYFELIGGSGAMIVSSRIDYEQIEEITLTAYCTDTGQPPLTNSTRILVHVRNINDNSPIFEQPLYRTNVEENTVGGRLNVSIRATDLDKGDYGVVRYMLDDTDPNAAFFDIDPITAEITIKPTAEFDREKGGFMGFNVIAYDSPLDASVRRRTSVPVYIVIDDVNDNCPVFSKAVYEGKVPESAEQDTDIIDIIVTDADEGLNSQVVFAVKENSGDPPGAEALFGIGRTTGRVLVNSMLRDKAGIYRFNITATDMNGNYPGQQCMVEVPVIVEVQESDNDAPQWIRPPQRDFVIYVLEEQYEGMLVYNAKAVDPNTGPNGVVDYYFTIDGNALVSSTPEFRINRVTGVIRAEVVFDREQRDNYFLTLMAKDRGNPAASSEITITVVILDVDDNDPSFPMKNGVVVPLELPDPEDPNVGEHDSVPRSLGHCHATDADSDIENNRIYYDLLAAKDEVREYITVNRDTCEITLTKMPDYETMPTLEFDVYAYNERNDDVVKREKREVNPSIQHVIVTITDDNDNPPVFSKSDYLACVSVNAPYRQNILEVVATDKDAGDGSIITYSITDPNFDIDRNLGIISNVISFRRSGGGKSSYTFPVTASDTQSTAEATVRIFVTSPDNIVKLKVNRPLTDVEPFKQQLINTLVDSSNNYITFACVDSMRNHMDDNGEESLLATDVFVTAVKMDGNGQYTVFPASDLASFIQEERNKANSPYDAIYVTNVEEAGESESFILEEDAVLAILIICILLIVLAIILVCICCYCIWRKKQRKVKRIKENRHHVVHVHQEPVSTSFNPVYHNAGQEPNEEYATVQKVRPAGAPIHPVVIPAPHNLQPLDTDEPHDLQPAEPKRPSWEEDEPDLPPSTSRWDPDEPEPVIETEIVGDPIIEPQHMPYRPFEPEYEDKIETEVADDDDDDGPPSRPRSASPARSVSPARSASSGRSTSPVHVEVLDDPPPPPPPAPPMPDYDEDIEVVVADSTRGSPPPSPPASSHRSSPPPSNPPSPRVERLGDDSD